MKDDECRCIHYEADMDAEPQGDELACCCGHSHEEHFPSDKYPGDWSCKVSEAPRDR